MTKNIRASLALYISFISLLILGCTNNPFSNSDIAESKNTLQGILSLEHSQNADGIYVFLDEFNIGTRTDSTGRFELVLPPPNAQGTTGGINGIYYLYYFMANYYLDSSLVIIQDGQINFDRGDFNKKGELTRQITLQKFLNISIEMRPRNITSSVRNEFSMLITMNAIEDSVTVIYPGMWDSYTAKTFFKEVNTDSTLTLTTNLIGHVAGPKEQINRFPRYRVMTFRILENTIPHGQYKVSPQLLVMHEKIPLNLIESLKKLKDDDGEVLFDTPYHQIGGELMVFP